MVEFFSQDNANEIRRRKLMAEQLRAQAQLKPTEVVTGYAVPQSPLAGLASALSQGIAGYQEGKASETEKQDADMRQKFLMEAIKGSGGDSGLLAEALMSNPAYVDQGIKLYGDNLKKEEMTPYQRESLDLQKERLKMQQNGGGTPTVNTETGEIEYQPQRKLSATEQKAFEKQQELIMQLDNAKGAFEQIKGYKDKPMFSGAGAGALASLDAWPVIGAAINDEKATNTKAFQNLILEGQYSKLQSTFPGAISNAEREAIEKLGALASYTPEQQAEIIKNAETGINRLQTLAKKRASDIASGKQYIDAVNPPSQVGGAISYEEYFK